MSGLNRSSSGPSKNGLPSQELLDDLCSRFVLNVPKEDQQSFERILFLVEYAHWFYEDNAVENNPSLKSFSFKEFTSLMFNSCDVLKPYVPHIDDIFKDFNSYKFRVPVTGAIILDETFERCLLVKGWKGSSWSFPRGKKNKDEADDACAVREVLEETGYDISDLIDEKESLEIEHNDQRVRLFIISGVKNDAVFKPQTKKEISEIAWHPLTDLQPASTEIISRSFTGMKLYMVTPFLGKLNKWLLKHRPPVAPRKHKLVTVTMWNARNNSASNSYNSNITESQPAKSTNESRPGDQGNARSSQPPKPKADQTVSNYVIPTDVNTKNSFQPLESSTSLKTFKFNWARVSQAWDHSLASQQAP